jgi:hypothetical protein
VVYFRRKKMRTIVYDYWPYAAAATPLEERCDGQKLPPAAAAAEDRASSVWYSLRPAETTMTAAGGGTEKKLIFNPCAYRSTADFLLKPTENIVIVFSGCNSKGYRPDTLYTIDTWPIIDLNQNSHLAIVVQNTSTKTNLFVHKMCRLDDLLQLKFIDSCLTLVSKIHQQEAIADAADSAAAAFLKQSYLNVAYKEEEEEDNFCMDWTADAAAADSNTDAGGGLY